MRALLMTLVVLCMSYLPYVLWIYDEIQHQQLAQQASRLISVPLVLIGTLALIFKLGGDLKSSNSSNSSNSSKPSNSLSLALICQLIVIYLVQGQVHRSIVETMGPSTRDWYILVFYCVSLSWMHRELLLGVYPKISMDDHLKTRLHQLLMINLFSLPLEPLLRRFDENFQELGANGAVKILKILDNLLGLGLNLRYYDRFTFYSDRFYLIINESCSGVNLLLSSGMFVFLLAVFIGISMRGTIYLFLIAMPLSMIFNMLRIALIFWLGHDQGVSVAMGPWHERSAYLSTFFLTLILMWIGQSRWLGGDNRT